MELSVATPLAAWGFASLLVPILIHFFANRWQQPIRFAALRFLQPAAEQGRARRLSDLLLLLLRLLLLAVMVLALMAPSLSQSVLRERSLTLHHPALPAMLPASNALTGDWFWLCAGAELRPPTQACASTADSFVIDLLSLLEREPDLAALTVVVPDTLQLPRVALPELPVAIDWQSPSEPVSTLATVEIDHAPWLVHGPVAFAPLFVAANKTFGAERWQFNSDSAATALQFGDSTNTVVRWHDDPLPWREASYDGTVYQFQVEDATLHLRVADAAELFQQPAMLATLLALSDDWLSRGQLRWQQTRAQLQAWPVSSSPQPGTHTLPLQLWLMLVGVLLLLLERGVVHGRR